MSAGDADGPVVAVGAVALQQDRLLLVRRGHGPAAGLWSVPGGRVELGESLREAVVREVAEETDLRVVVEGFLGWTEILDGPEHFVILDFSVTPLAPNAPLHAGDDAAEAEWVALGDLSDVRLVPGLHDFLEDCGVLDGRGRTAGLVDRRNDQAD